MKLQDEMRDTVEWTETMQAAIDKVVKPPAYDPVLNALRELELCTRQFIDGTLIAFPAALLPQVRVVIAWAEAKATA